MAPKEIVKPATQTTSRIFIHSGPGISAECVADTKAFMLNHVVDTKDVQTGDIRHYNFDQLVASDNPTIVFPGGKLFTIFSSLRGEEAQKISHLVKNRGFNYVGVCAGGYLGANQFEIIQPPTKNQYNLPISAGTNFGSEFNPFAVTSDFNAFGPLHDDSIFYEDYFSAQNGFKPFLTTISMGENSMSQLCVAPCLFERCNNTDKSTQVVSTYSGKWQNFQYQDEQEQRRTITSPVAMFSRPRTRDSNSLLKGGMFFSGTHFEACGKKSKLLEACQSQLSREDTEKLVSAEADTVRLIAPVIKQSLGLS